MKKDRWLLRAAVLLIVSAGLMTTVSLAAEAGSAQDPLVTLSYLNDTFFPQIMQRVDQKIAEWSGGQAVTAPGDSSGENDIFVPNGGIIVVSRNGNGGAEASASFEVVSLGKGQVLTGGAGCEVLLRSGGAACISPSEPGLVDETSGLTLDEGASLEQNHLYMMTAEGQGLRAEEDVTVMVRGSYAAA